MTVSIHQFQTHAFSPSGTEETLPAFSIDTTGLKRPILVVLVSGGIRLSSSFDTLTWDAPTPQSFTNVTQQKNLAGNPTGYADIWYLEDPSPGSYTLTYTTINSAAGLSHLNVNVLLLDGASLSAPVGDQDGTEVDLDTSITTTGTWSLILACAGDENTNTIVVDTGIELDSGDDAGSSGSNGSWASSYQYEPSSSATVNSNFTVSGMLRPAGASVEFVEEKALGISQVLNIQSATGSNPPLTISNYDADQNVMAPCLVVVLDAERTTASDWTGTDVTFNGVSLTKAESVVESSDISGIEIWYMVQPPRITADIVVSMGGTTGGNSIKTAAFILSHVHPGDTIGATETDDANSDLQITITPQKSQSSLVIAAHNGNNAPSTSAAMKLALNVFQNDAVSSQSVYGVREVGAVSAYATDIVMETVPRPIAAAVEFLPWTGPYFIEKLGDDYGTAADPNTLTLDTTAVDLHSDVWLVALIGLRGDLNADPDTEDWIASSVTYEGEALAFLDRTFEPNSPTNIVVFQEAWVLKNPPSAASGTLQINWSNFPSGGGVMSATYHLFANVKGISSLGTANTEDQTVTTKKKNSVIVTGWHARGTDGSATSDDGFNISPTAAGSQRTVMATALAAPTAGNYTRNFTATNNGHAVVSVELEASGGFPYGFGFGGMGRFGLWPIG